MTSFNTTRFLHVIRREYILGRRPLLTGAGTVFAIFFLLSVPQYFSGGETLIDLGQCLFYPLAFIILFGGAFFYSGMKTKQQRLDFLVLPASNLEKFIGRWLISLIGFFAMMILGFLVADLLQYLICLITGLGRKIYFTLQFIRFYSGSFPIFSDSFPDLMGTLWIHSIYLLGSQLFRKHHWFMTTLTIIALIVFLAIAGSGIIMVMDNMIDEPIYVSFNSDYFNSDQSNWVFNLLIIAITLFNAWLSYRLFCRKQIINNRFFNI